ncbi:MAG: glycosyltransferase family 2 protein [Candidatus Dactylopiibacterium sp.]|nr:glycosyltransferase family 2 protein [Candidatus Dactylopiibacterium sp.]
MQESLALPAQPESGGARFALTLRKLGVVLRGVLGRGCLHRLQPAAQISVIERGRQRYRAEGQDPHFRMQGVLAPGWYMVELQLDLPGPRAMARFYLDHGEGESEANAFSLPVRKGRLFKRLVQIRAPARLRFDPMETPGEFRIERFNLAPVSAAFAITGIRNKLLSRHPRYAAGLPEKRSFDALRADYESLFERRVRDLIEYSEWISAVETPREAAWKAAAAGLAGKASRPLFSIVVPVYNTDPVHLEECLASVREQLYPHWQLCIADDASRAPHVKEILQRHAAADARIRIAWRERNGHISAASNSALELATGDWIVLLDHDDVLAPQALLAAAQSIEAHPQARILYSDEDKLDEHGERRDPFFKPAWNPDLLWSQNYISHLGIYRHDLVRQAGGFREGFEGSQDYDLLLRCLGALGTPGDSGRIVHIPEVLYHWRMAEGSTARGHAQKDYASEAGRRALQDFFDCHHPGVRASIVAPGIYRHAWPLPDQAPLVSLIVPTRDAHEILRTCIESILASTTYPNYEILVVDNQSRCERTLAYLRELEAAPRSPGRVRVLHYDAPFNYSAINNFAVRHARGEIVGLINNDVEVISPGWLGEMVSHALRPDIGCVGAKLYYPDNTLQHGGVVLGIGGVAGHAHKHLAREEGGYFSRMHTLYNPSAVTAAVLLVRKRVFQEAGGLDEVNLRVAFNDVDFCLRVREAGYRNLWTCHAELYHHESKTRGTDSTPDKQARFVAETRWMQQRWAAELAADPAYHACLSRQHENFSLVLPQPICGPAGVAPQANSRLNHARHAHESLRYE